MSVLIEGMEMPKSCSECRFFVDAWCYAFKREDWRNAYNRPPKGEKLKHCPLIEVPDGHGRLIDEDALLKVIDENYNDSSWWFINRIEDAPIIIPSDEVKE